MNEDEAAIRRVMQRWFDATRAGDVDAVLGLMTDDAIFLVPGKEPFGRDGFAKAALAMKGARIEGSSEVLEVQVAGDWAHVRGQVRVAVDPRHGGPARRMAGHTLSIFRRGRDGQWRLSRDANLLMPVAG